MKKPEADIIIYAIDGRRCREVGKRIPTCGGYFEIINKRGHARFVPAPEKPPAPAMRIKIDVMGEQVLELEWHVTRPVDTY